MLFGCTYSGFGRVAQKTGVRESVKVRFDAEMGVILIDNVNNTPLKKLKEILSVKFPV